jgi:cold shock CspA family protein
MSEGTIMSDGTKGFWFAEQDETREIIFVHISQVLNRKYLHRGDRIKFEVEAGPSGKLRAANVELTWQAPLEPNPGVRP